jgi:NADH-quinone oxidoreductase subunit L
MLTLIAVFAPLTGAIIAGLFRPFIGKNFAIGASILFMIISSIAAIIDFALFGQNGGSAPSLHIATWISVGSFTPDWSLRQDALSLVMVTMVSVVSMIIHVYSIGYMAHDKTVQRFFA